MGTRGFWELDEVSDDQLRQDLAKLLANGYRTEARIVAHLAELDERRLHVKDASESLFSYCTQRLGLSNSEAFHRITAARVARQFPAIFELIERRALHLTAVCLLRDYLTAENHRELLAEASHQTKWQVQELIARRFPKADAPSTVRKLPTRSLPVQRAALPAAPPAPAVTTPPAPVATTASTVAAQLPTSPISGKRSQSQFSIEPTSEARYRIQLSGGSSLKEKLELARALVSHSNPGGDIAVVIERALDLLIEKAQKQRFGKIDRPHRRIHRWKAPRSDAQRSANWDEQSGESFVQTKLQAASAAVDLVQTKPHETPEKGPRDSSRGVLSAKRASSTTADRRREHVPHATRREIAARDGMRCTFVGANGCRCETRAFLQIHHEKPWARGGGPEVDNLRLLCAGDSRARGPSIPGWLSACWRAEPPTNALAGAQNTPLRKPP